MELLNRVKVENFHIIEHIERGTLEMIKNESLISQKI